MLFQQECHIFLFLLDLNAHVLHMIRIILKLKKEGDSDYTDLPNGHKRCFGDLMSHRKEIEEDNDTMYYFEGFYTLLDICLKEKVPPRSQVLEIFGKMLVNSFDIMDDTRFDLMFIQ